VYEVIEHIGVAKEEIIYVGDQHIDMQTAENAGIFGLWAGWGYETPTPASKGCPYEIIEHPFEVLRFIGD
jgi:phosphoglycolate phosphatase